MLPHTKPMLALCRQGKVQEAKRRHNARVKAQFDAARQGQVINLSDLMAAKEEIDLAEPAHPGQSRDEVRKCRQSHRKEDSRDDPARRSRAVP